MWPENKFWALFDFQRLLCKMESKRACVFIWTNFDSFANTYLS